MRVEATIPRPPSRGGEGEVTAESQIVRSLKLIPDFDESRVGLVANKLTGKALHVYDRMVVADLEKYEEFMADILRAYELRPEAYR
ncbi:hypothetical protein E2C01_072793 [Portunus trituberculatus]|uniref:Uncharacterized protein n=1 Tax=Portunus trituberculatus TaxID=210409 RepID=A0A5B7I8U6_PORTR|nr:hypothetical protein [Portunus trituberculatus]